MTREEYDAMLNSPSPIESAPGKEIIENVVNNNFGALKEFYACRVAWCPTPIQLHYLTSYSIYDDLLVRLSDISAHQLLESAFDIALEETDEKHFRCAVFLLASLSDIAKPILLSIETFRHIETLHQRVSRLSYIPGMAGYWNEFVEAYQYAIDMSLFCQSGETFVVDTDSYLNYFSLNHPYLLDNSPASCPVPMTAIKDNIKQIKGGVFTLVFLRTAALQGSRYWMWLYRNDAVRPVWHWYVWVRENEEGQCSFYLHPVHISFKPEYENRLIFECQKGLRDSDCRVQDLMLNDIK